MIRKASISDAKVLTLLEKECFPVNPWPEKEFIYELNENPFSTIIVFEDDKGILGYVDLWILYDNAQIANIAVSKTAQRKGIGDLLLKHAIDQAIKEDCENLSLEVRVSNNPAINLYRKNGFINASIRKNYYENGENAYLMVKPIGGLK